MELMSLTNKVLSDLHLVTYLYRILANFSILAFLLVPASVILFLNGSCLGALFVSFTSIIVQWLTFYPFGARYAIGGLAGGEDKDSFWRVVAQCTAGLPENKPRYVMVY